MRYIEITTKLSRLKSVSSIDDDYLEAATGCVLKNFVNLQENTLCWSLFSIKLQACKFIEKRLQYWCFPLHVKKFFRTPLLIFWWRKCSLKLDYGMEWQMFLKMPKSFRYTWWSFNVSILNRLKRISFS